MKRTTVGKPTFDQVLLGDADLACAMAAALAAVDLEDRLTHGFHTYPAGLHPDAARDLLTLFPGASVLDPFCGGGKVLVEGRVAGRRTVGADLSRTALRVASARAATPDDERLTKLRSAARRITEGARKATEPPPEPVLRAVQEWYAPHVLAELHALRRGVAEADPAVRPLLEAVLSSILIKVSWRRSDTSAQRVRHDRPRGTTAILFHKKTRELARRLLALREQVPPETPETELQLADARALRVRPPVELVLTSPPYPGTYDYLPMQHLRRIWMGEQDLQESEIGARRAWREGERTARARWVEDTHAWTKAAAGNLAPGGHLVIVIGDGLTPGGVIDTSEPTEAAARAAGLRSVARASLERPDHARETVRWEHVFAFRKPSAS